jgi:hypothetical protein
LSYAALCSQKYQSEERCTRPFNVAGQAEPVAVEISIVSSRAGSLPACLNVTDDSEPSVWFSLEGLSLRTRVAHDETALFLSNTTFSPDGMLGSTAGVPQSASASDAFGNSHFATLGSNDPTRNIDELMYHRTMPQKNGPTSLRRERAVRFATH